MRRSATLRQNVFMQITRYLSTTNNLSFKRRSTSTIKKLTLEKDNKFNSKFKTNDQYDVNMKRLPAFHVRKVFKESIYDPFDFSLNRIRLERKVIESKIPLNSINSSDLYLSPEILARFVSSTGRILHSDVTGLNVKDQKKISRAIRRCQAIGLMSKTSNDYNR